MHLVIALTALIIRPAQYKGIMLLKASLKEKLIKNTLNLKSLNIHNQ